MQMKCFKYIFTEKFMRIILKIQCYKAVIFLAALFIFVIHLNPTI